MWGHLTAKKYIYISVLLSYFVVYVLEKYERIRR